MPDIYTGTDVLELKRPGFFSKIINQKLPQNGLMAIFIEKKVKYVI